MSEPPPDMPQQPAPQAEHPSTSPDRLQATALAYDPNMPAPRVVASGSGAVAKRIVEIAQAAGVPVRSDPALARALATLDLGDEVPEAMYRAVAAALAWAYKLDDRLVSPPGSDQLPPSAAARPLR